MDVPEVDEVVRSDEKVSQSQGNAWSVAAMVPLSDNDVTAGRALVLSVAELRELVDADGKLVVLLSDVESYAEADGIVKDTLKGARGVSSKEDPRVVSSD